MTNFQPSIYYPVYDDSDGSFELVALILRVSKGVGGLSHIKQRQ